MLYCLSKIKYSFPVLFILAYIVAFDSYFAFVYKMPMSVSIMASIFETSASESEEAVSNGLFGAIGVIVFTLFLFYMVRKEFGRLSFSWVKTMLAGGLIAVVILSGFIFVNFYYELKGGKKYKLEFSSNTLLVTQEISSYTSPFVINDIIAIIGYQHEKAKMQKYEHQIRSLPEYISFDLSNPASDKIFLVIGESSTRKHYSLYGYPVPTTPYLDELHRGDSLLCLSYYDGISSSAMTRDALRMSLSFSTPFDQDVFFTRKNVIELANDAGYETIWLSNQDKLGLHDTYTGFIASGADHIRFSSEKEKNDLKLIDLVDEYYKESKKQFFVIHLYGSHIQYKNRYDKVDESAIVCDNDDQICQYDRSIHHTDRVLSGIAEYVAKESSSCMLYFSDHGEKVGIGHGLLTVGKEQFEIPYLTVNNSQVPVDYIVGKYIDKESNLLNNLNSIFILSEMMGYKVTDERARKALHEARYIYHVDRNTYLFEEIEKKLY